ncbi:hypothetical protein BH11GEM1_BH11GEM1_06120 [soil metagenome]
MVVLVCAATSAGAQKFPELAKTPPMGWNSWNRFQCNVRETLIRETADAIVANGMRDAGYQYVNVDDCWHGSRDSLGFMQPDAQRFPSGMKALADYVHGKGLKLGIYSDAGWKTCGGRPGSRGYESQDAQQYARWGVDYLKYDWCNADSLKASGAYTTMRDAIDRAGRPMVFSICEWGDNQPRTWAPAIGHLWRTTGDITNCRDCELNHGTWSQWGVLQIIGNDLRSMPATTREILTNRDVIAVDQDSLGVQGYAHKTMLSGVEIWVKPLVGGAWAMAVLNRSIVPQAVVFDWQHENVGDGLSHHDANFGSTTYAERGLWTKRDAGTTSHPLSVTVAPHGAERYRLRKL